MRRARFNTTNRIRASLPALLALAFLPTIGATAASASGEPARAIRAETESPHDASAVAEPAADSRVIERARPRSHWGPHAVSRLYGLSYIEEDDEDGTRLQGISLLWSSWDETVDFSGGLGWWLAYQEGGDQEIVGGGFESTWLPWVPRSPARVGPRFRLGIEHRRRDPDEGLGGLFAAGLELAIWLGDSLQIAAVVDREWPFRADERTQFGLALRFARRRY